MEQLGTSYIMVIEPLKFDINHYKFNYDTMGVVFATQSMWFRDHMYDLIVKYLKYWQHHFTPKVIKEIKDIFNRFLATKVKREDITIRFFCGLGLLAYYITNVNDKALAFRKFTAMTDIRNPMYYVYVGIKDHNTMEILDKIDEKFVHSHKKENWFGSCFQLYQVAI